MALSTIPTIAGGPAPVTITTTPTTISKATATTTAITTPTTTISSSVTAQSSALKSPNVVNKTNSSVVPLFDYYLFEERNRRVEECHDGADRHKGCYFIFRGDDKVGYAMPYNALSLSIVHNSRCPSIYQSMRE